ncbi:Protein of unknown function [Gryllus bimaculatus]|nr:Protein of unknown function [Gryllus bimaculatus]
MSEFCQSAIVKKKHRKGFLKTMGLVKGFSVYLLLHEVSSFEIQFHGMLEKTTCTALNSLPFLLDGC